MIEREFKFVVKPEMIKSLEKRNQNWKEISQFYLDKRTRVRSVTIDCIVQYYFTHKRVLKNNEDLLEFEYGINEKEFNMSLDLCKTSISKKRWSFDENETHIDIDIFNDFAMIECEVGNNCVSSLPDWLDEFVHYCVPIKHNKLFSNYSLSKKMNVAGNIDIEELINVSKKTNM